jgi:hypothetical protein
VVTNDCVVDVMKTFRYPTLKPTTGEFCVDIISWQQAENNKK